MSGCVIAATQHLLLSLPVLDTIRCFFRCQTPSITSHYHHFPTLSTTSLITICHPPPSVSLSNNIHHFRHPTASIVVSTSTGHHCCCHHPFSNVFSLLKTNSSHNFFTLSLLNSKTVFKLLLPNRILLGFFKTNSLNCFLEHFFITRSKTKQALNLVCYRY